MLFQFYLQIIKAFDQIFYNWLVNVLDLLTKKNTGQNVISTQENLNLVTTEDISRDLENVCGILQDTAILTQENMDIMTNHNKPHDLASVLESLKKLDILTQDSFNLAAEHFQPDVLAKKLKKLLSTPYLIINFKYMFNFLCSSKILTQENFDVIINGAYSYSFTNAFLDLSYLRILTQENLNHIAVHSKPQDLVDVFRVLLFTRLRLLCSNNKAKVAALINTNISNLVELFFNLEASDILTQDIFNFVVTHPKLDDLVSGFSILLNQRIKATIIANYICILGNHRDYVRAKNLLPISIQNMLVPKEYYDMREKYLNFIAAFWLGDIFKSLPIMAISHILEFVQIQPMQRQEAMNIMQNIQLPQELDFDVYKNILKDKVDEYTQFQAHLSLNIPQRMLNEKGLFLRLERWSFWTNRHASAELQHAFDKQYGLTIVS